ncbi:hypothetical protein IWZ01DRAFT_337967 [Phyllosticta capitalensis]
MLLLSCCVLLPTLGFISLAFFEYLFFPCSRWGWEVTMAGFGVGACVVSCLGAQAGLFGFLMRTESPLSDLPAGLCFSSSFLFACFLLRLSICALAVCLTTCGK